LVEGRRGTNGRSGKKAVIKVLLWRDDRAEEVAFRADEPMMDLLRRLGIRIDGALVMRAGRPVPLDDPVLEGDELTVIDVQSGG
jgi:sulfur carrier protein ThiS